MKLGRMYWVILLAEIAACSGKAALRYRPRRDAVHQYVVTMRSSREGAPIVAAVARTAQVWTIYYTQFGRFTDPHAAGSCNALSPSPFLVSRRTWFCGFGLLPRPWPRGFPRRRSSPATDGR